MFANPLLSILAAAIRGGESTVEGIVERLSEVLGELPRWLWELARRYLDAFPAGTRPRIADVELFLRQDRRFRRHLRVLQIEYWLRQQEDWDETAALPVEARLDVRLVPALAAAILAAEATVEGIAARIGHVVGVQRRWMQPLARRYLSVFAGHTRPRRTQVEDFLRHDRRFAGLNRRDVRVQHWLPELQRMQPVAAAAAWPVPAIESTGDLADWLALYPNELLWFADLKGLAYKLDAPKLRHYHYHLLHKDAGSIRLIEAPKQRLKYIQRQILERILDRIPPHPAVQGFRKGRSIRTFAQPHVGRRVVLRMDLRNFFPSISGARIQTFFRTVGYPESVADLLGGICTNATPRQVLTGVDSETRSLYTRPHLPQGAPTSPALANFCAYRLDCRLAGLAKAAGATYTRYADDLAFSGGADFERGVNRFATHVAAIVDEEGFAVNHRKTRVMRQGVRQHLAGLVTNEKVNVRRADFDRLKATLYNCVRHGPESQNREGHAAFRAHLEGRVSFVESINPEKGKRLRALFEKIEWPSL